MDVLSIVAQKGGAGKTTLTLHWAVEAERQRYGQVAIIDMDTQASATSWYERRESDSPIMLQADESNLQKALMACEDNGVDLVLIDTMPRVERPSAEAAKAADLCIIPCGPSVVDIEAIGATIEILNRVRTPGVIVLNQGRPGSNINVKAVDVLCQYELPVCPIHVMRRASLMDAFTDGRAVAEIEPNGKAADEITLSWKWIVEHLMKVKYHAQESRPRRISGKEKLGSPA